MNKVLVIDDSDAWAQTVEAELGKAGYSVLRARQSEEALETAADEKPELVLVDLLMAARAGAGFFRRMRTMPMLKNTLMLLTTTGTAHTAVEEALGVRHDQIIRKNRSALDEVSARLRRLPLSA